MVAVAETPSAPPSEALSISLAAGEEASGLARITGQYLEQLLADSPEKRAEASRLRGRMGLHAREGDVQVTLFFEDVGITIEEGLREPDAVMSGPVETFLNVLAGRTNPAVALGRRSMSIRITGRKPLFGYQAYHLMRLPDVHVWSGIPPRVAVAVGVVGAAVLFLLWSRRQARPAGGRE